MLVTSNLFLTSALCFGLHHFLCSRTTLLFILPHKPLLSNFLESTMCSKRTKQEVQWTQTSELE